MTRRIGITGLGHVGMTVLHDLLAEDWFDEYVLIDPDRQKAEAEALDLLDREANTGKTVRFFLNDIEALREAAIVVSSLGKISLQGNQARSRFAELPFTSREVKKVSEQLVSSGFQGIVVVITNPVDVITALYQHYTGFPKEKVIGTGTLLDTARLKRAIGQKLGVRPTVVEGYVLGEHGHSQFPAWSKVTVDGQPITELLPAEELTQLADNARQGGHTVFWGKGYTNFAIAAAAKRLIGVLVSGQSEVLPVSHYLSAYQTYASFPVSVGASGIERAVSYPLTNTEEEAMELSTEKIRAFFRRALEGNWGEENVL